jgi:undecaprenyl-diphosphatase
VVEYDQRITSGVADFVGATGLRMMAVISELGDTAFITVFALLILVLLLARKHWLLAIGWGVTVLGSSFLIGLSKEEFQRARPVHVHGFADESTWSFPSGHAAGSMVFYGMLAYVLLVRLPAQWHRPVLYGAASMVVLVGASRVILQVHYLSDVFAGFSMGLAWLALCIGVTEFLRTAHQPKG